MRGLKDQSRAAYVLSELSNLDVNLAAVQETHFVCVWDCCKLSRSNDLSWSQKVLLRVFVVGDISDPLEKRLDPALEEICSQ